MIKNINNLNRFDFTNECRNCKYKKDIGFMEYCCSFVYDLIYTNKLFQLKKEILGYIVDDTLLDKIDSRNILFNDDEITFKITLKTNLRKELIKNEMEGILESNIYFKQVKVDEIL